MVFNYVESKRKQFFCGIFPNSSELSSISDQSCSFSSSSSFSDMDTFDLINFIKLHPIKVNCLEENTYADLALFAKQILEKAAKIAPHASPSKKTNGSNRQKNMELTTRTVSRCLFFDSPLGQEILESNKIISLIHEQSGRSYESLMNQARTFKEMIAAKGTSNCEFVFKNLGVIDPVVLAEQIDYFSPVELLMILFLIDKYPTAPQGKLLQFFELSKNQVNLNIYTNFKKLDDLLYTNFPTKTALANYDHAEEINVMEFF